MWLSPDLKRSRKRFDLLSQCLTNTRSSFYYLLTCSLCVFQFERVRVIYKYALDRIPKQQAQELFKNYTVFEKRFGDRRGIEDVIVSKRRFQYEEEVKVSEIL